MSCDFLALANAGIQGLSPYQAGKPIEELERELGISGIVKLASNENPLGPSAAALTACEKAERDLTRYPDANGFELKQAIAEKFSLQPNQLTLGAGSNDVLDLIARVFLSPHASSVFSQYGFVVYPIATQACGARAIVTPAKNWGHDLDAMAAAIAPDTRVVFIANPNNPTGTSLTKTELLKFLRQVPANVVVVLDEAYTEYVNAPDFPNGLALLSEFPNLIVTRTFSKAYGLAGLRVGYAASNVQIADLLNRVRAPFNVNALALAAATATLADDEYLQRSHALNLQGMQQVVDGVTALDLAFIPSVGNFITVEMPSDALPIYQRLLREGVIVRPLVPYGMPKHLRISIGLPDENAKFLSALRRVL
ncbi:MAG: aspartate aminotransferase [Verrucomicrobiaceae bacterium]|nr:aspartate aminotransferase [Verrucomicrobiaceae bacterium]